MQRHESPVKSCGRVFFHGHHDPYHFAGLTHYQLREVLPGKGGGPILSQTTKVSWCLSDHRRVSTDVGEQSYPCSGEVPGISVGWSDTYAVSLFGQSVSIAGIPPGEYWVVVVASSVFAEKEYRNNTSMTRIQFDDREKVEVLEERAPEGVAMKDPFDGFDPI